MQCSNNNSFILCVIQDKKWLQSQEAYILQRGVWSNFKKDEVVSLGIDSYVRSEYLPKLKPIIPSE